MWEPRKQSRSILDRKSADKKTTRAEHRSVSLSAPNLAEDTSKVHRRNVEKASVA